MLATKTSLLDEIQLWFNRDQINYREVFGRLNKFDYRLLVCSDKDKRKAALLLLFTLFDLLNHKCRFVKKSNATEVEPVELLSPFCSKDKAIYLVVNTPVSKIDEFNAAIGDVLSLQRQTFERSMLSYVIDSGNRKMLVGVDSRSALKFAKDQWLDATPDPLERQCFLSKALINDKTGLPFELKIECRPIQKGAGTEEISKNEITALLTAGFIQALHSFTDDSKFNEKEIYRKSYLPKVACLPEKSPKEELQKEKIATFIGRLRTESPSEKTSAYSPPPTIENKSSLQKKVSFKFSISPTRSSHTKDLSSTKDSKTNPSIKHLVDPSPKVRRKNRTATQTELGRVQEDFSFTKPHTVQDLLRPRSPQLIEIIKKRGISSENKIHIKQTREFKLKISGNETSLQGHDSSPKASPVTKKGLFLIKKKEPPTTKASSPHAKF